MAATSPYQNNDYSVLDFRPTRLPVNDIFKAITAQNAYWDQGAQKVKSRYDDALNLKLSLAPNQELRDNFMREAEQQISKLSSMNLADPSVQKEGFKIFKPLFEDEGVIYDDAMTRHFDKVRSDALSYRQKDNGKGFSDVNFQYAMEGYDEFVNSTDRFAGKNLYQKRKEYTPYYDYSTDYEKALKDCKPSSASASSPYQDSGYLKSASSKFLSAEKVGVCLEAGMSANGLRQMQIEGVMNYKGRKDVLAADVSTYLSSVSGNLSNQLQEMAAQKATIQSSKDLSAAQKKQILEQMDEQMKGISGEMTNNQSIVSKLGKGDFSPIEEDMDHYAGSVYSFRKLQKKALAASYEDKAEEYKSDPVRLTHIRFLQEQHLKQLDYNFDVSLDNIDHQHDLEIKRMDYAHDTQMKMYELMYGSKSGTKGKQAMRNPLTGEIELPIDLQRESGNLFEKPEADPKAYDNLRRQVDELNTQDKTNNIQVYNRLIERAESDPEFRETLVKGFNQTDWETFKRVTRNNNFAISEKGGAPGGIQETSWFKAYSKLNPKDEVINQWANSNTNVNLGLSTLNRKLELGEKQVMQQLGYKKSPAQIIADRIKDVKTVTVKGTTISPEEMLLAINGNSSKLKISIDPSIRTGSAARQDMAEPSVIYTLNGVKLGIQESKELAAAIKKVDTSVKDVNDKVKEKRAQIYGELGYNRDAWFFTHDDESEIAKQLQILFPDDKGKENKSVAIVSSDFSGGIKVNIPGDRKSVLQALSQRKMGTVVEAGEGSTYIIKGTNYNVLPQAINNPTIRNAAYQLSSIGETAEFKNTAPGAAVKSNEIEVPVMVNGQQQRFVVKTMKIDNQPQFQVFAKGANTYVPIITSSNAFDLMEQLASISVRLNKK